MAPAAPVLTLDDKRAIIARVVTALRDELAVVREAARDAIAGATSPENRAEHSKDMRATEASYVAAGTGARVLALDHALAVCAAVPTRPFGPDEPAQAGALVLLEDLDEEDPPSWYLLMPEGGGLDLRDPRTNTRVRVLTPRAPLGGALFGKAAGASIEIELRGAVRSYELARVL